MFLIYDGRESFYQWDLDRKLIVKDNTIKEVHFCNKTDDCSLVCETYTEGGLNIVNVPNILLQDNWRINVYAYDSNYTKFSMVFDVVKRSKPADYTYTETEVKRYEDLENKVNNFEGEIRSLKNKDAEILDRISILEEAEVDLTGYATEDYVDKAIESIEVSGGVKIDTTLTVSGASADAKVVGDNLKSVFKAQTDITKWNYETKLPDMNGASINSIYNINGCLQSIKNIPNINSTSGTLITFNGDINRETNTNKAFSIQMLIVYPYPQKNNITFIRSNWGGTWQQWDRMVSDAFGVIPNYANFSAFKRFGTIGDSLSTGTYSNKAGETVEHLEKSWGTHIANKCDNQCLTLGFGGATTTRWIDGVSWHENNLAKALLPENECDAYILCLGYNDNNSSSSSGGVPLGTIDDIDTANPDNNANTYYGNIDKICRKLYTTFPKTKIFVLNNPYYNTEVAESYNKALKDVCNRLNGNPVYLIDMYSKYNGIYKYLVNDREGNHYHPQVYQYMGMLIATAISDYMRDNYTKFKYIENEHITIKEEGMELIEKVEITEEGIKVVDFKHNLKRGVVYCISEVSDTITADMGVQAFSDTQQVGYAWISSFTGTKKKFCSFNIWKDGKVIECSNTVSRDYSVNASNSTVVSKGWQAISDNPITMIRLFGGSSKDFSVGTTFELWGVKA